MNIITLCFFKWVRCIYSSKDLTKKDYLNFLYEGLNCYCVLWKKKRKEKDSQVDKKVNIFFNFLYFYKFIHRLFF